MTVIRQFITGGLGMRPTMRSIAFLAITLTSVLSSGQLRGQADSALRTVKAIRTLSPDQARRARPVRVTGVVTALSGWKNSFFLQDRTAGISVDRTDTANVKVGDQVEVRGVSNAGLFAPTILASQVRVAAHVPLPPARQVNYSETSGGQEDSQRIEVKGVVHSARISQLFGHEILQLSVELGGGEMGILLQDFAGLNYNSLIDSTVRVRGVCSTSFNQRRQFIGLAMFVPDQTGIDIVRPSNQDPFSAPATSASDILQFGQAPHRVKVTGTVTYQIPGHAVYLQDGGDGIRIESSSNDRIEVGRVVEAVGFPARGDYAPVLKDGVFRSAGHTRIVKPLSINADDVIIKKEGFFQVPYDNQLVQLTGRIAESYVQNGRHVLILRRGTNVFEATFSVSQRLAPGIQTGSTVLLTGICAVHSSPDSEHQPLSFGILVRSPEDIVILEHASWWTVTHAGWVVGLLAVLLLAVSGWLVIVRREDRLRALTVTDPLSGLYNRRGFLMLAERQWQFALRKGTPVLLFYIDLNSFKQINDTYGHQQGDVALVTVSGLLRDCFRKTDVIARVGGDEFAVLAMVDSADSRELLQRRISKTLQQLNQKRSSNFQLSLSIGVLTCDRTLEKLCIEDLISQADGLMYQEKRSYHLAADLESGQERAMVSANPV